jgi:hypothetical protein
MGKWMVSLVTFHANRKSISGRLTYDFPWVTSRVVPDEVPLSFACRLMLCATISELNKDNLKGFRSLTCEPRPKSGLDYLICTTFARKRVLGEDFFEHCKRENSYHKRRRRVGLSGSGKQTTQFFANRKLCVNLMYAYV